MFSAAAMLLVVASISSPTPQPAELAPAASRLPLLGATATVVETESELPFRARVDTGARLTSIHVEQFEIDDEAADLFDNIGKPIRLLLLNRAGGQSTIHTTIHDVVIVRQSEGEEARYIVPLTLSVQGVQRRILVSLNDRSRMSYALLLGRNFIRGEFLVDVTLGDPDPDVSLPATPRI